MRVSLLLPLVYEELRKLAAAKTVIEQPGPTLQPTALVHEAWNSRGHFFAAAAEALRRILVENARRKGHRKHGGELQRLDFSELELASAAWNACECRRVH